jgi:hypothetical protein
MVLPLIGVATLRSVAILFDRRSGEALSQL